MGTNYYIRGKDVEEVHVGKRSAAGLYCWDCNMTLCIEGPGRIHQGCKKWVSNEKKCDGTHHGSCDGGHWFDSCPSCGKNRVEEDLDSSSAGRELGFNKSPYKRKTGVATCSSFTWAGRKIDLLKMANDTGLEKPIFDEYDRAMTVEEFLALLTECPIQSHLLGLEFS